MSEQAASAPRSRPRAVLVTNASAGTSDEQAIAAATEVLAAHLDVDVRATDSPDDLDDALADTAGATVVVAGGDGSIHAVVAALHRGGLLAGADLALLPLGTGNDFARTLGLPRDPVAAAQVVVGGVARPLDLVVDDADQVTVNHVHLGAGAAAGERGARWKQRLGRVGVGRVNLGRLGYPVGALQTALRPPTLHLLVEVDGRVVATPRRGVLMVAVGNGASVGGGTELTPDARPDDGLVDVLVATPAPGLARLAFAARLPFARHGEHEDVTLVRGREVRVAGDAFACNSDGEIGDPVRSRSWRVLPGVCTMRVPGGSDADDASA